MSFVKWITRRCARRIPSDAIILFSPPRSGSTLIYNVLREVFAARHILKVHSYRAEYDAHPVVVTYRHPLDMVASILQFKHWEPTEEALRLTIDELERNGIWDLLRIKNLPNVVLLRYELFNKDLGYVFDRLEKAFGVTVPAVERQRIGERYQIESVEKVTQTVGSDRVYDPTTLFHGNHISKFKGQSFYYSQMLTPGQIAHLQRVYEPHFKTLDYPLADALAPSGRQA